MKKLFSFALVCGVFLVSLTACASTQKPQTVFSPESDGNTEFSEEYLKLKEAFADVCEVDSEEISLGYRVDFCKTIDYQDQVWASLDQGRPYFITVKGEKKWIYVSAEMVPDSACKFLSNSDAVTKFGIDGQIIDQSSIIEPKSLDENTENQLGSTTEEVVEIIDSEIERISEEAYTSNVLTGIDKIGVD